MHDENSCCLCQFIWIRMNLLNRIVLDLVDIFVLLICLNCGKITFHIRGYFKILVAFFFHYNKLLNF